MPGNEAELEQIDPHADFDERTALILHHDEFQHTYANITWLYLKRIFPMILGQIIRDGDTIFGGLIISSLNTETLAATAYIFTGQKIALYAPSGLLIAINIITSNVYGKTFGTPGDPKDPSEDDRKQIAKIFQYGKVTALFTSLMAMGICYTAEPLLLALGEPEDIAAIVGSYFEIYSYSMPFKYWLLASQRFIYGINEQSLDPWTGGPALPVVFFLGYGLVHGKFGLPQLGADGYAYAILANSILNAVLLDGALILKKSLKQFNLFSLQGLFDKDLWKNIFKTGLPLIPNNLFELLAVLVISIQTGYFDKHSLAAQGLVSQIITIVIVPMLALQKAETPLIGQFFGDKKYNFLDKYHTTSISLSTLIASVALGLSLTIPRTLASAFIDTNLEENQTTLNVFSELLPTMLLGIVFDSRRFSLLAALRGITDTAIPTVINLGAMLVGLGLQILFAFHSDMGISGITLGRDISLFLAVMFMQSRWESELKNLSRQSSSDSDDEELGFSFNIQRG